MFDPAHDSKVSRTVVGNDDERRGSIECLRHILSLLPSARRDEEGGTRPDSLVAGPDHLTYHNRALMFSEK